MSLEINSYVSKEDALRFVKILSGGRLNDLVVKGIDVGSDKGHLVSLCLVLGFGEPLRRGDCSIKEKLNEIIISLSEIKHANAKPNLPPEASPKKSLDDKKVWEDFHYRHLINLLIEALNGYLNAGHKDARRQASIDAKKAISIVRRQLQ
jgi:hypothetical protein